MCRRHDIPTFDTPEFKLNCSIGEEMNDDTAKGIVEDSKAEPEDLCTNEVEDSKNESEDSRASYSLYTTA